MFHFFKKEKKDEKVLLSVGELSREVAALEYANSKYCDAIKVLQRNVDFLNIEKSHAVAYRMEITELPVKYVNTAFYLKRNELMEHCNATLATSVSYEDRAATIAVYCRGWRCVDGYIVLELEDPYGFCFSQGMRMSVKEAEMYQGHILYAKMSSAVTNDSEKESCERLLAALKTGTRNGVPAAAGFGYRKTKMPDGVRYIYELERSGYKLCTDAYDVPFKIEHPISEFAFQYAGVTNEAEAVDAISAIQNYTRAAFGEDYLAKRLSPTQIRVSAKSGCLQEYYFKDNALWLREEENASAGWWKYLRDREDDEKYALEHNWPTAVLRDDKIDYWGKVALGAYNLGLPEDVLENLTYDELIEYQDKIAMEKVFEFHTKHAYYQTCEKELERFLERYRNNIPELKDVNIPAHILKEKMDAYSKCSAKSLDRRLTLLKEGNKLVRERYKDFLYYYKVHLKYGYELHSKWYPWFCLWSNYGEWRHTFFDVQHRLMNGPISVYTANPNAESMVENIKYMNIAEHIYHKEYGTLIPGDDARYIEDDGFFYHNLKEDFIGTVVAYCDSASSTEQGVNLHVIDPTGETTFYHLPVPAVAAEQASGRMVFATFGHNYYREEPTLTELQILPYTLKDKLGDYTQDTIKYRVNGVSTYVEQPWLAHI